MKTEWFETLPEQCPPEDAELCNGSYYRIANGNPVDSADLLRIDKILDFCDVPQLFVARDAFDTLYLCLLYDDEPACRYTGIRISAQRLKDSWKC